MIKFKYILANTYNFRTKYKLTASQNKLLQFIKKLIDKNGKYETHFILNKEHLKSKSYILIFAPIEFGGLTTQLLQLTSVLDKYKIFYKISWHSDPKIRNHKLNNYFIPFKRLLNLNEVKPSLVFTFERFNIELFKYCPVVFYINIDWLSKKDLISSRLYADYVLYPIDYREKIFRQLFKFTYFQKLYWPAFFKSEIKIFKKLISNKLSILYMGNNFNESSRKNPDVVLKSLNDHCFDNLKFTIKTNKEFSSIFNSNNDILINTDYISQEDIAKLYLSHNLALICNSSEGNGLTIIEAIEAECVPILVDGEPMNSVLPENCCFRIKTKNFQNKKYAKDYCIEPEDLSSILNSITMENYSYKYENLLKFKRSSKFQSRYNLEKNLKNIFDLYGLIDDSFDSKNYHRKKNLENVKKLIDSKTHIVEVYISTTHRLEFFKRCLKSLELAISKTQNHINVTVVIDGKFDNQNEYFDYLKNYNYNIILNNQSLGLNHLMEQIRYNLILKHKRSEKSFSGFVCYLQDDCIINSNKNYFDDLIFVNYALMKYENLGLTTGFKNQIHPGFKKIIFDKINLTFSNSIDGKNFFTFIKKYLRKSEHPSYNQKYQKYGNPGPNRGSHFDIFFWKDDRYFSKRVNVILDDYVAVEKLSKKPENSTWGNSETDITIERRVKNNQIYK